MTVYPLALSLLTRKVRVWLTELPPVKKDPGITIHSKQKEPCYIHMLNLKIFGLCILSQSNRTFITKTATYGVGIDKAIVSPTFNGEKN